MINVVIPYFQRQPGILQRALVSAAAQLDLKCPVEVIVVDDESPVAAQNEVDAVQWPQGIRCRVVHRANGGPGAARNTGLDAVSKEARFIAFLDSDDEWTPLHLARAVAGLESGFDFYFSDLYQIDQAVGAFARGGRLKASDHPRVETTYSDLHEFRGDLFDQTLRGNVIGTPTVVYRREGFGHLRFATEFTSAGEDYLFWMAIAKAGARVVFSGEAEVRCGRGVNVYAGAGWGTPQHLLRIHQEVAYRKAVTKSFDLNAEQAAHVRSDVERLRIAFTRDVLHRIRHRVGLPLGLLLRHASLDPALLYLLPANLLRILRERG